MFVVCVSIYLPIYVTMTQVEVTKYEELEETHAELKLKQLLWNSLEEWDVLSAEWTDVSIPGTKWGNW